MAPERRLILVSDQENDDEARRSFARVGLEHIEGFLQKGMPGWVNAGMEFTRTTQLSTKEVARRDPRSLILDVRSHTEWTSGHISGAIHIPLGELTTHTEELPKASPIIAVCGSGYRSSIAASLLQAKDFTSISSMDGGMTGMDCTELANDYSLSDQGIAAKVGVAYPLQSKVRSRLCLRAEGPSHTSLGYFGN